MRNLYYYGFLTGDNVPGNADIGILRVCGICSTANRETVPIPVRNLREDKIRTFAIKLNTQ